MNDLEKAAQIVLDAYKNGHDLVKPMTALSTALLRGKRFVPPENAFTSGECGCEQCQVEKFGMCLLMPFHLNSCGNKRCPKSLDHRFKCTNSNEPGQIGELDD